MVLQNSDMQIRYSKVGGGTQNDPDDSIGGAMADNSPVSATINDVFDNVLGQEARDGAINYRILYIRNANATDSMNNVTVWFTQLTTSVEDELSIALMASGKNGTAERLTNEDTAPTGGEVFTSPITKGTGIVIGTLAAGDNFAIGIRRVVDSTASGIDSNTGKLIVEGDG